MTAVTVPNAPAPLAPVRKPMAAARVAFRALLLRDLVVLRKTLGEFVPRTVLQPFLLVFVQAASSFSTLLVAGVVGLAILFQGIQSVSLPMVQEFGYTREIEDRVLAPMPVWLVAIQKAMWGALSGLISALLVFPIAAVVPATPVHLDIHWLVLLTLTPLACYTCGALGLTFGTRFDPRTVPLLFGIIVIPITFLGCVYYSWSSLQTIRWLQIVVLTNPLVYISEGFRGALTDSPHMSLWAVYGALVGFAALFTWLGINGFKRRVLS
jgi:ABC-2 type transport system permease protein